MSSREKSFAECVRTAPPEKKLRRAVAVWNRPCDAPFGASGEVCAGGGYVWVAAFVCGEIQRAGIEAAPVGVSDGISRRRASSVDDGRQLRLIGRSRRGAENRARY